MAVCLFCWLVSKLFDFAQALFPMEAWPPTAAVRELATRVKASKKDGVEHPFVHMDLKKFLPPYFREHAPATVEDLDKPAGNKGNKRLDLSTWLIAWDRSVSQRLGMCVSGYVLFSRHALAAAITYMMDYKTANKHKCIVEEIAATAYLDDMSPFLGVCYDEVAR